MVYIYCSQESLHLKVSCSGLVTAMACHPQGVYCVAALSEKINVWEVSCTNLDNREYVSVSLLGQ